MVVCRFPLDTAGSLGLMRCTETTACLRPFRASAQLSRCVSDLTTILGTETSIVIRTKAPLQVYRVVVLELGGCMSAITATCGGRCALYIRSVLLCGVWQRVSAGKASLWKVIETR